MNILRELDNWLNDANNDISEKQSIVKMLRKFGFNKVLWFTITNNNRIFVEEASSNVDNSLIDLIENQEHFSVILKWIKEKIYEEILKLDKFSFNCILSVKSDPMKNVTIIISDTKKASISIEDARIITKILLRLHKKENKIKSLENSLTLSNLELSNSNRKNILENYSIDDLPHEFINDVIPFIWYAVVHEQQGPVIFEGIPREITGHQHMMLAVNIFSSLDSDMIGELGHVYSFHPVNSPRFGEVITIVFSIANSKARGDYELHGINILIDQDFVNLSKSLVLEIKTHLFAAAERMRLYVDKNNSNLSLGDLTRNLNDESRYIKKELKTLRKQVAFSFATLIEWDEIVNWAD